jgi:hypothetical protein
MHEIVGQSKVAYLDITQLQSDNTNYEKTEVMCADSPGCMVISLNDEIPGQKTMN